MSAAAAGLKEELRSTFLFESLTDEQLDWLAGQFIEKGWSMKSMHRLIMLSSAYRLGSVPDAGNARIDPENQYVWRMNRRRLDPDQCPADAGQARPERPAGDLPHGRPYGGQPGLHR